MDMRIEGFFHVAPVAVVLGVSAAPPGRDTVKKQEFVDACLSGTNLQACSWATGYTYGDVELTEKLQRRGCDGENLASCHGLVSTLEGKKDREGAIALARKNCEAGYSFSCESAGYFLKQKGSLDEARLFYRKSCSQDQQTLRGCDTFGELSASQGSKSALASECQGGARWACYALGFAEKASGDGLAAKSVFVEGCGRKASEAILFCGEAFKLVEIPRDVRRYLDGEKACAHWAGEEAYDQRRGQQIQRGVETSCRDRHSQVPRLKNKYANDPDALFVLENASKLWR